MIVIKLREAEKLPYARGRLVDTLPQGLPVAGGVEMLMRGHTAPLRESVRRLRPDSASLPEC